MCLYKFFLICFSFTHTEFKFLPTERYNQDTLVMIFFYINLNLLLLFNVECEWGKETSACKGIKSTHQILCPV